MDLQLAITKRYNWGFRRVILLIYLKTQALNVVELIMLRIKSS